MPDTKSVPAILRKPFPPEQVGQLPRGGIQLDYVGHADVTSRLLEADPEWNWQPVGTDEHGLPLFDTDAQDRPVGLWIRLTVGGVTRLGYGSCPSNQGDAVKVLIGDALRNAAMRFGVALDLWAKGDRADPAAENASGAGGHAQRRQPKRRVITDDKWLDEVKPLCATFATDDDGRTLWRRVVEKVEAKGCTDDDAKLLKELIQERHKELKPVRVKTAHQDPEHQRLVESAEDRAMHKPAERLRAVPADEWSVPLPEEPADAS